jgi:PKHD-type hydroxylase
MYPFPPSPDLACKEPNYAFWPKAFDDNEISRIIELGENYHSLETAQVASNNGAADPKIRKSKVSWLPLNNDTGFIYDRIRDIIVPINGQYFQFDLYGFVEHLQYTVYEKKGSHYTWHIDKGMSNCSPRKLSVVIQLSDPSEYEGGALEFMTGNEPEKAKKEKGMLYAFPSYILHRVAPVTSGIRRSLVIWLSGPKFK